MVEQVKKSTPEFAQMQNEEAEQSRHAQEQYDLAFDRTRQGSYQNIIDDDTAY